MASNHTQDPLDLVGETVPRRIVSLVPSYTESLFDLGFGETVVGISDYCIHPTAEVQQLPRVGGPKNPRITDIQKLRPDLVIANREENARDPIMALQAAGIPVWITFPQTVQEAIDDLYKIAGLFHSDQAMQRVQALELGVEWARLASQDQVHIRYFCPIWQDQLETGETWWMTCNADTYTSDLLGMLGGENIFGQRRRRYPLLAEFGYLPEEAPGDRDTRYPRVTREEIIAGLPEVLILPDEPYVYKEEDIPTLARAFTGTPAISDQRIFLVEGSLITWCGTRLGLAVQALSNLFQTI